MTGNKFAAAYSDDGKFYIRVFGKIKRSEAQIKKEEISLNDLLDINNFTMCHNVFPDPFITCCFVDSDTLFVGLFYNFDQTHIHFYLNIKEKKIVDDKVVRHKM